MADLEDVTLDGRPLHSLRVADLKAALEERGLPKSGQKNALIKRLKGALMLENLQRTSTPHIGLQPNSQIGEEMSQNSFIKQYLAKQQELLRQRLEREAREAAETDDQEDNAEVNNSSSSLAPVQDVTPVLGDQHKLLDPSDGEGLAGPANEDERYRAHMPGPAASALASTPSGASAPQTVRGPSGDQRPAVSHAPADSDDNSDGADEDGEEDDDWGNGARRRQSQGELARGQPVRENSGGSRQPQQHIPPLMSPQLRQPTPPPSPPPELSFPLPDTPKQSPPSPGERPARLRTSSTSSSGSSSSGSRSSSPEPQSGNAERKPGPLTLLARKMESEGAFSGAGWHGRGPEGERLDNNAATTTLFPGRGPPEGMVGAISHTTKATSLQFPMIPVTNQSLLGAHLPHSQTPVSVLRATALEEQGRERELQLEREKTLEQERQGALERERQERQRYLEQERAIEQERERALEQDREERQKALERVEREKVLQREMEEREKVLQLALERERTLAREREEREKALERERVEKEMEEKEKAHQLALQRELALERERTLAKEREEKERSLAKEREEREKALARERALELESKMEMERQRVMERERILQQEREEKERALQREREIELERARALERERVERERALQQERAERERALENQRMERERALELERERALEQERIEREKAIERERIEKERALEQQRKELEAIEKQRTLERESAEKERLGREKAAEHERQEREEREKKEKALEEEKQERERAQEKERIEKEQALERERALEKERKEREEAAEREKQEKEATLAQEKALQKDQEERDSALEQEKEREKRERESHLPLWKRGREIGLTHLPTSSPLSTAADKVTEAETGKQQGAEPKVRPSLQTAWRDGPPPESSTPMSPTQSSTPSTQSSFKKFRFLRDNPATPPPSATSMVIKRPRTFSDSPQPHALPLSSPTKPREQEQEQELPLSLAEQATAQMPARQAILVSGPHGSDAGSMPKRDTPVIDKIATGLQEYNEKMKVEANQMVTDKQEVVDMSKRCQEVKDASPRPVASVKTTEKTETGGRHRRGETKDKRGTQASSSSASSSSDSDSGSSSSHSSGSSSSSSSPDQIGSAPNVKRSKKPGDRLPHNKARVLHPDDSTNTSKTSLSKKGESVEEKAVCGTSHSQKQALEVQAQGHDKQQRGDHKGEEERSDKSRSGLDQKQYQANKYQTTESILPTNCQISNQTAQPPLIGPLLPINSTCSRDWAISNPTPKAFTARRISLSCTKSPGSTNAEGEQESGAGAGRKRRWGSSTAVTAKKPSISITTDSLKSLIPDIRPCQGQEAVVDLHPEEAVLSGAEDAETEGPDQELQIRRTVTQVVPSEGQENGQKESKRSRHDEEELAGYADRRRSQEDKGDGSFPGAMEITVPSPTGNDADMNTLSPGDSLILRSISQQKSGVSVTIDDPVRTARQPSPPRGKVSCIVHVSNLVRPFTLGQLKELLGRTGTLMDDGFWIDKIKSHCYVTYSSTEEAVATRAALHGVKWPQSNPKVLTVDFSQQEELDFHKGLGAAAPVPEDGGRGRGSGLPSLLPERDQWAEREREMARREKARAEREWDQGKVREFGNAGEKDGTRRSHSRERKRKESGKGKEKKAEKKGKRCLKLAERIEMSEKASEEPPAKLLDDLFRKTKAAPCIYWLPLTDEQYVQREAARAERMKEREKRRKEIEEEEVKKREEERKEKMKAGGGTAGEGERERDRERGRGRDRDREGDKRREAGYRRPGGGSVGGGRRSRSRSDPRDRRR
ncbi:uncharacterized protein acin1a [Aplochiton taeniatus]